MAARTLILICLLGISALAAPAPNAKPKKLPTVKPGAWILHWGNSQWNVNLEPNGQYSGMLPTSQTLWLGQWSFDQKTRKFAVVEGTGQFSIEWEAVLDESLSGVWKEMSIKLEKP
jgi:hypothetical protein